MPFTITGVDEFEDFARDVRDVDVDQAIENALEQTGEDYVDTLTGIIQRSMTDQGGTFHSRTSPYAAGDKETNESGDSLHMAERNGWQVEVGDDNKVIVKPKPSVEQRAEWMEWGTSEHGPEGDTPMHFWVGNTHIIVTDGYDPNAPPITPDMSQPEKEDMLFEHGIPGTVEGVEPQYFFSRAANALRRNDRLRRNLEQELWEEFAEARG